MTQLRVDAVIGLVDRLSGPLNALLGRVNQLGGAMGGLGTRVQSGMGFQPVMHMVNFMLQGQEDLDRALRQFSVVAEDRTGNIRRNLNELVMEMAPRIGVAQLDIIRGASEAVQAGLSQSDLFASMVPASGERGERTVTMIERLASAARVANASIPNLSRDIVTLAQSFNLPWANAEQRAQSIERLIGVMLVAPRLSPDSPEGHARSLLQFGPVFRSLGGSLEDASALQGALSAAGFRDARAGYALTTLLARFQNPTGRAQMAMQYSGFNMGRIFNNDVRQLDADKFIQSLGVSGINAGPHRNWLMQMIANGDGGDLIRWKNQVAEGLGQRMGFGRTDARNRGILRAGIDALVSAGNGTINVVALLEELAKMPASAFKDLAGINRMPQAQVLATQQALRNFVEFRGQIGRQAPTALDEGLAIRNDGWAYQLEKLRNTITTLRDSMWRDDRGGGVTVFSNAIGSLSDSLQKISQLDGDTLSKVMQGIAVSAGAGAGLVALGASLQIISFALTGIATRGPVALGVMATMGLAGAEVAQANRLHTDGVLSREQALEQMRRTLGTPAGTPDSMVTPGNAFIEWLKGIFRSNMANAAGLQGPTNEGRIVIDVRGGGVISSIVSPPGLQLQRGTSMPEVGRPAAHD